jgi:hypothetical protein
MKRILRWWVGDLIGNHLLIIYYIDSLKPLFTNELQDVLKFIRFNVSKTVSNLGDSSLSLLTSIFTDTVMQKVSQAYNEYLEDKRKEDEAEAQEIGATDDVSFAALFLF